MADKKINKPKRAKMSPMSEAKKRSIRESRIRPVRGSRLQINAARASDTKKRVAAKKKAAVTKSAAEGPKRSRVKPSATAMAIAKSKPKVVESGVGNIPMSLARLGLAIAKFAKPVAKPKAKPSGSSAAKPTKITGQTQNPTSGRGSGQRRNPIGPNMAKGKNSFAPAQKGQVTKNANKAGAIRDAKTADAAKAARAKAAAQKKAVAARNAKVTKAAPYAAAGAVAAGAGGMTMAARREKQQKVKSAEKGLVWNGQRYVKK